MIIINKDNKNENKNNKNDNDNAILIRGYCDG